MLAAITSMASGIDYIEQGNKAYEQKQYKKAVQMYEQALHDGESAQLRYNLGNAYYRLNDSAYAILNYEKALKLDPSNGDARHNLNMVLEKTKLNQKPGSNFFSNLIAGFVSHLSSNSWAIIALVAFLMTLGGIACYRMASSVALQKTGFFSAIALGIITLLAVASSFYMYHHTNKVVNAIVMTDKAPVNKSPRGGEKDQQFTLMRGTKVEIIDSISGNNQQSNGMWYKIETLDKKTGWMKVADIEKI